MKILIAAILVAACACGTSRPPVAVSTATDARVTNPGAYALFQHGTTRLEIVDEVRGKVVASTDFQPAMFHPNARMPFTSASVTRFYYLDAGTRVAYLTPNGDKGVATTIALAAGEQAAFAVSTDDSRIAVAILSYDNGFAMRLYVEDLLGGGNHVDIFSSASIVEWPIGWVGGNLLLAVGGDPFCNTCSGDNPYAASSYHLVDPRTGRRITSLCSTSAQPQGPVEPAGVMCWGGGGPPTFLRWDGSQYPAPAVMPRKTLGDSATLSPDGTQVLVGGFPVRVLGATADYTVKVEGFGSAIGWIDAGHVVVRDTNGIWLIDPRTSHGVELRETGPADWRQYLGTLPAAIS